MWEITENKNYLIDAYSSSKLFRYPPKLSKIILILAHYSPETFLRIERSQTRQEDSNLRPIAPKSLVKKTLYLRFEAINSVI